MARIVDVLVPVALDHAYSYRVPDGLALAVGDIVAVPLGPARRSASSGPTTSRRSPGCTTG